MSRNCLIESSDDSTERILGNEKLAKEESTKSEILVSSSEKEPSNFDQIIGCIEDIVIEDEFQKLQENLLATHYIHFDENVEENKLIYTDIFQEYTTTVEGFIEAELEKRIKDFDMKSFISEFEERKANLEGEVFDMLFTLTDFVAFKEMFVDYKVMKEAGVMDGMTLSVSSLAI